jgi:hypothetical protein
MPLCVGISLSAGKDWATLKAKAQDTADFEEPDPKLDFDEGTKILSNCQANPQTDANQQSCLHQVQYTGVGVVRAYLQRVMWKGSKFHFFTGGDRARQGAWSSTSSTGTVFLGVIKHGYSLKPLCTARHNETILHSTTL